jgi:hypothetical protein
MSSDRELLELAAKAAGLEHHGYCTDGFLFIGDGEKGAYDRWNPLTDDGDALRLAVKLLMQVECSRGWQHASVYGHSFRIEEDIDGRDPCTATRRAIVRAAAEIGRSS